jgi:hypothetical protein
VIQPVLGRQLAFAAHGVDQPFTMQGRAHQSGGDLQRRDDGRIEFAYPLPVIEADDTDVLAVDQDGHDGRGPGLVAGDAGVVEVMLGLGAEHHALARLQHVAEAVGARLVPGIRAIAFALAAGVRQGFVDPLGLDLEPLLAIGAVLGEGQGGAVHLGSFA